MANIDLAGTKLRLVKTEYGLVSALVGVRLRLLTSRWILLSRLPRLPIVALWGVGDFDSAGRTGLVRKMETLGFGHHTGFVSGAGRSDCAAHTVHVVAGKRTTDLAAHMNLVGKGGQSLARLPILVLWCGGERLIRLSILPGNTGVICRLAKAWLIAVGGIVTLLLAQRIVLTTCTVLTCG
jgi:hypothetical protein